MCLAVPGKIVSISGEDPLMRTGKIDFGGVFKKSASPMCRGESRGLRDRACRFALNRVDEDEAAKIFEYLREMEDLAELKEPGP